MKTMSEIKNTISGIRELLFKKYAIKDIGVFGSYIRNEQHSGSDIDILVEFKELPDLLTLIELENFLEDQLELKVDLVEKTSIRPQLRKEIIKEVVSV